jgi:hypothetical protein
LKEFLTEIEINASPEKVREIFSDVLKFNDWNPFIRNVEGKLFVGTELKMQLNPPGDRSMDFHPKVLTVIPNKGVSWQGHIPAVFTGTHKFTLEPISTNRTRFTQHSEFSGLAARFAGSEFVEGGGRGFIEMEHALKDLSDLHIS